MAMQLSKTLPNSVTGNYWAISNVNINLLKQVINVTVSLWVSSTEYSENAAPIFSKVYYIDNYKSSGAVTSIMSNPSGQLAGLYSYLEALPDFSGSTTVS